MSRSARKATARRIWLTARLILATRGAGQRALNSPRRRRIRERPGRGARQREDEQAEAHPYGLSHPAHQAERDCRRRSEAQRGERDHIAALEGAEARRDQERGEADRGAERLDHGGRRQRDGDAQELQDQPGLERAKQPRDQMEGDREDDPPGGGLVETREHVVDAPERLGMPVLDPELSDEPPAPREHAARLRQDEARERDRLEREEPEHPVEQGRPRQGAGPGQRDAEQQEEALRDRDRGLRDNHGGHARVERDPAAEEPRLNGLAAERRGRRREVEGLTREPDPEEGAEGDALAEEREPPAERVEHHDERSEEHTSELQSLAYLVCRLLLEKKKKESTT